MRTPGFGMQMKIRKVWTLAVAAALLVTAGVTLFLLRRPARDEMQLLELLPPDLDLYAVADLQSLSGIPVVRRLLSDPPGLGHDAEYDQFIRSTGFRYQDDLKFLALGRSGDDWVGTAWVRIDRARIAQYLDSQGAEKGDVQGRTFYTFGRFRPFRLVMLDDRSPDSLVAFTVGGDNSRIRQAVERRRGDLRDSAASEFERSNDRPHLPPGSKLWLIARPERIAGNGGAEARFGSLGLNTGMLRGSKTIYVSLLSGTTRLELHAEDFCDSPASAQRIANSLRGILALLRAMPSNQALPSGKSGAEPDARSILAGISVEQAQQSVMMRWQLDEAVLSFLESNSH
jgi:hypothetical protein